MQKNLPMPDCAFFVALRTNKWRANPLKVCRYFMVYLMLMLDLIIWAPIMTGMFILAAMFAVYHFESDVMLNIIFGIWLLMPVPIVSKVIFIVNIGYDQMEEENLE